MITVKATNASRLYKKRIKEFGRIVDEGEVFEVTEDRFNILNGANRFNLTFVVPVEPVEDVCETCSIENIAKEIYEEPEIYIIEPGKEPVKVDENLEPVEKPKKKRSSKKKVENEENRDKE